MIRDQVIQLFKRLKNILFLLLVVFFSLWRGPAKKKGVPKKIAIIYPTNNIGDMVCITPLFHAIKRTDPSIHLTVIGSPKNELLLVGHAFVDAYVYASDSVWSIVRYLRKNNIDGGIAINMDSMNVATLFLGGVACISTFVLDAAHVGFMPRPMRIMSRFVHAIEYSPGRYIPRENLRLLAPFNIATNDATKILYTSEDAVKSVATLLGEKGILPSQAIVAIAPGAGADYKRWPAKNFAMVANAIYKKYGMPIVIIGGPSDQAAVSEMVSKLAPHTKYINPGPQSLHELKATLARSLVVIGNDSGAIHVGEALGAMTITIAGATDVGEHMEEDEHHKIVKSTVHGDLYRSYIGNEEKIDPMQAGQQMKAVLPDHVLEAVDKLLGGWPSTV